MAFCISIHLHDGQLTKLNKYIIEMWPPERLEHGR